MDQFNSGSFHRGTKLAPGLVQSEIIAAIAPALVGLLVMALVIVAALW